MKKLFGFVLVMVFMLNLAFSAGVDSDEPVLQVVDYDVVPETIYPGTTGQLQLTIGNSGSETATGTTVYYTYYLEEKWNIYVGDIGSGSEAITTIPFKVPETVDSGIIVVTLDLYYFDEDGTTTKHSKSSIPITVTQQKILEVKTLGLSGETLSKGEEVTVDLEIFNTGGVMKNVRISTNSTSFSLAGTSVYSAGEISKNSSKTVSIVLASSSSAEEGKYTIPLTITYNDALQNEITETINIGPVMVTDSSALFRIHCQALSDPEIGSELEYEITIENRGSNSQSAKLTIEENDVFTPIGPNTIYFDEIPAGGNKSETIILGIDSSSASGYYVLPLTLKTNGDEINYNAGIAVHATPDITLTTETESGDGQLQVTVRVANSGNTIIRSLYISAQPTDDMKIQGSDEKFIGTLNVDDFATFQITLEGSPTGELPLTIVFKDNDNFEHTLERTVEIESGSLFSFADDMESGPPERGPNLILYAGAIVVAVIGFFAYKKWKGR